MNTTQNIFTAFAALPARTPLQIALGRLAALLGRCGQLGRVMVIEHERLNHSGIAYKRYSVTVDGKGNRRLLTRAELALLLPMITPID